MSIDTDEIVAATLASAKIRNEGGAKMQTNADYVAAYREMLVAVQAPDPLKPRDPFAIVLNLDAAEPTDSSAYETKPLLSI